MLNNPNWDISVKEPVNIAPLLTVGNLISWLEGKNPEEKYVYTANKGCMLYQYLTDSGVDLEYIDGSRYVLNGDNESSHGYPSILNSIAYGYTDTCFEDKYTFGAALIRARRAHDMQGYQ